MVTREQALRIGAEIYEIPYDDANSRWRTPRAARARWYAWQLLREDGWTLDRIAKAFEIHHTSVMHGLRRIEEELK
jgi:chromosomal replication initiation ATPase DnaA